MSRHGSPTFRRDGRRRCGSRGAGGATAPLPLRSLLLPFLLGACGAPAPPPSPPSLGYDAVSVPQAVYVVGDTARVEVDAAGRTVEADVASGATLDVRFRPGPAGVTVTASFREFSALEAGPAGSSRHARPEDVEGLLVFDLDRRGDPTLTAGPELRGEAAHFLWPEVMAATLFPRLPGRAVVAGDRWTDTIRLDARQGGARVTGSSVVTYVAVGDTALEGRPHLRVELEATDRRELMGRREGSEVSRTLSGASTGWFLWDLPRGLLRESVHRSDLSGRMDVESTRVPFSLRVRSRAVVRLVDVPAPAETPGRRIP